MEIDLQQAYDAYAKLSDKEKEIIRKVMTGPEREILKKYSVWVLFQLWVTLCYL